MVVRVFWAELLACVAILPIIIIKGRFWWQPVLISSMRVARKRELVFLPPLTPIQKGTFGVVTQ